MQEHHSLAVVAQKAFRTNNGFQSRDRQGALFSPAKHPS
jgi:hypothetical protein